MLQGRLFSYPDTHRHRLGTVSVSPSSLLVCMMVEVTLFSFLFSVALNNLGTNYQQIPVNCPYAARINTQQRDGAMTVVNTRYSDEAMHTLSSLAYVEHVSLVLLLMMTIFLLLFCR